jgi:hypothetical protein
MLLVCDRSDQASGEGEEEKWWMKRTNVVSTREIERDTTAEEAAVF